MVLLILLNTIVLALDRYPLDPDVATTYNTINTVLTWLFFVEMSLKLIGLSPKLYAKDRFNLFDAFITCLTIAENIIDLAPTTN